MTGRSVILALFVAARFAFAAEPAPPAAAAAAHDLGEGLRYHRVHQLPADLPTNESTRRQPCVLDLRYVTGDATAAAALQAWLKFHATARAPVLVLCNSATSAALVAPLTGTPHGASLVVIGETAPGFTPDIVIRAPAAAERAAYDALERGAPIGSLLRENAEKPRNDEASLTRDHPGDSGEPDRPAGADPATATPKAPPPPIDTALQRAVQLHRALLALRKL